MNELKQMVWTSEQWDAFLVGLKAAAIEQFGDGEVVVVDSNAIVLFEGEGGGAVTLVVEGTTDEPPKTDAAGRYYSVVAYEGGPGEQAQPVLTLRVAF